jgi:hypothetical protein
MKTKKGFKLIETPKYNVLNDAELNNLKGGDEICVCNTPVTFKVCVCDVNPFNVCRKLFGV